MMFDKGTNIQNMFELLLRGEKRVILFGAGKGLTKYVNKINRYIWWLCDDWKTPAYISNESQYTHSYVALEQFVDYVIDNDENKQHRYIALNGRQFQVKPAALLEKIDSKKYILIIVTDKYEKEIREQLEQIENIKDMPRYSYWFNMHYYETYSRGLIVDRVIKPYMEQMENYYVRNGWQYPDNEYDQIKELIGKGEYIANGVAFQITTICNLKCKYCADYVPKMREHRNMDLDKVLDDIDTFFRVTSKCLYVQLSTAEALLCPNLGVILEKLLSMDKVRYIEIFTNGVSYPKDEKVLKLLSNPKIVIYMSNYNMPEKTDMSRKVYEQHGIHVLFSQTQSWKIEGTPPYDHNLSHEALCNTYMMCEQAYICPHEIAEGRLTRCGRIQRFVEVSDFDSEHDYIDFVNYQTEEELKRALIKLNLEPYLDGCAWCAVPCQKPDAFIPPAEQLA